MRWLAFVLLAPMLCIARPHGGWLFLSHTHDDHGSHSHPLNGGKPLSGADHATHHGDHDSLPGDADEEGRTDLAQAPDGVIVSVPDHQPVPARTLELRDVISPTPDVIAVLTFALPVPEPPPRPGGMSACPVIAALTRARFEVSIASCARAARSSSSSKALAPFA
jgi:hypothetical protein